MFIPIGTDEHPARRRFPAMTVTLVILNGLVFFYEWMILAGGGEAGLNSFILRYGAIPQAISSGERLYTLVTSMFLHGSWLHLLGNMLYLLIFGDNVEDRMGAGRYLGFYLVTGLLASGLQILIAPSSPIPSVGASGAIAGVLGGYIVLFPRGMVRMFMFFGPFVQIGRASAFIYIALWFVLQFFSGLGSLAAASGESGGIAYWAHVGGFVAGWVLARLFRRRI